MISFPVSHAASANNYWVQAHDPVPFVDRTEYRTFGEQYDDLATLGESVSKSDIPDDGIRVLHKSFQPERGAELKETSKKWGVGTLVAAGLTVAAAVAAPPLAILGLVATGISGAVTAGTYRAAQDFESSPQIEEQGRLFKNVQDGQAVIEYRPLGEEQGQEIYRFAPGTSG